MIARELRLDTHESVRRIGEICIAYERDKHGYRRAQEKNESEKQTVGTHAELFVSR